MGCLCPNKNRTPTNNLNEKLNEEPETIKTEDLESHITIGLTEQNDLSQKRKLAEYLLENDINIFKRHLDEIRKLNDEDFNELFKGNTEHKFHVQNEKEFKQLAQKFEDNYDLISNFYNDEKYYKFISEIWRANILQKLKDASENEKKEILKKNNRINTEAWDENFKEEFENIINISPTKTLAERMRNYIKADYGNFDELIQTVQKCKNTVETKDQSHCNKVLRENLGATISKTINSFIPKILSQKDKILKDIKNKEEEKVINTLLESGLSEENKKRIRKNIEDIYKEKSNGKITELFGITSELEKIKELSEKFENENLDDFSFLDEEEDESGGKLNFEGANFKDKAEVVFNNEIIKDAILSLSMANVSYSIMHLTNTLMNYDKLNEEFTKRLNEISKNFTKHQNEMTIISEDVDEAIDQILGYGKKFQQDLEEVEELIKDINDAVNKVKNGRNNSILNLIGSAGGILITFMGASYSKGETQFDYVKGSIANTIAAMANITDIVTQQKLINNLNNTLNEAKTLEKKITDKIDELRKKFNELSGKHYH